MKKFKKSIKNILVLLIVVVMFVGVNSTLVFAKDNSGSQTQNNNVVKNDENTSSTVRDIDTGYIMRENFTAQDWMSPGWDRVNLMTDMNRNIITSINRESAGYMTKEFMPQSNKFVMEFRITLISDIDSGAIKLMDGDKDGLVFVIYKNDLCLLDASGIKTPIFTLRKDEWTGIKVEVDVVNKTFAIYINGTLAPNVSAFTNSQTTVINKIYLGIDKYSLGSFALGTLYLYKGYNLYEHFLSASKAFDIAEGANLAEYATITTQSGDMLDNNMINAPNVIDKNDATFWENDSTKDASFIKFLIAFQNRIVNVKKIKIKFAKDFKGVVNVAYYTPGSFWLNAEGSAFYDTTDRVAGEEVEYILPNGMITTKISVNFREDNNNKILGSQTPEGDKATTCSVAISEMAFYAQDGSVVDYAIPDGFTQEGTKDTFVEEYYGFAMQEEYNVLCLNDKDLTSFTGVSKTFDTVSQTLKADFRFMIDDASNVNSDGFMVTVGKTGGDAIKFFTKKEGAKNVGYVSITGLANDVKVIENVVNDIWYSVQFKIKPTSVNPNNQLIVSVNGWNLASPISLKSQMTFDYFKAVTGQETKGKIYVDGIEISKVPARRYDMPAPEAIDTGDNILTLQTCSIYREGTHLGWDWLNKEGSYGRKPILGWMDEGTPEVVDWEIKWLVEHGVNNLMYCWYRCDTGAGPIMKTDQSSHLWEGLFNAEYRDMLDFSVMFTNNWPLPSTYSYQDMLSCVMTYYIETFFRNPNYSKTKDNEPILYIYEAESFYKQIGDITSDGVANELDTKKVLQDMRQLCVDAGFGGLKIATEYRGSGEGSGATHVQKIARSGYDFMFSYCWVPGTNNLPNDDVVSFIQNNLNTQRDAANSVEGSNLQIIPSLSKSWKPGKPMPGTPPGAEYKLDLEHYRQEAVWARDVFKGANADSQGTKLFMLDNWMELNEGHWLFPTYDTPAYKGGANYFGYLDVLRETFGIGEYAHTDNDPIKEGFGPYDKWYPNGWHDDAPREIIVDNSVKDTKISDSIIGNNTTGGQTTFVKEVSLAGEVISLSYPQSVRVSFSPKLVNDIKNSGKGLNIQMKYGSVNLTKANIINLSSTKQLDIVINQLADISHYRQKAALKQIRLYKNNVIDVKILQSNKNVVFDDNVSVFVKNTINSGSVIDCTLIIKDLQSDKNNDGFNFNVKSSITVGFKK